MPHSSRRWVIGLMATKSIGGFQSVNDTISGARVTNPVDEGFFSVCSGTFRRCHSKWHSILRTQAHFQPFEADSMFDKWCWVRLLWRLIGKRTDTDHWQEYFLVSQRQLLAISSQCSNSSESTLGRCQRSFIVPLFRYFVAASHVGLLFHRCTVRARHQWNGMGR